MGLRQTFRNIAPKQFALSDYYLPEMTLPLFLKNNGRNFDVPYLSIYQTYMLCFYQTGCFLRMLSLRIVNMSLHTQFAINLRK